MKKATLSALKEAVANVERLREKEVEELAHGIDNMHPPTREFEELFHEIRASPPDMAKNTGERAWPFAQPPAA